jgi:outer membrane protein assembly factor BamB
MIPRPTPIRQRTIISTALLIASLAFAACGSQQRSASPIAKDGAISPAPATTAALGSAAPQPSGASLPVISDVPTYKGNASRSGVQPGPGPVATPALAWEAKLGCSIGERAPVVGNGLIFVGCDAAFLFGFDARTGRQVWKTALKGALIGSPAYGDGVVYAADTGGSFHALDAATGAERWHVDLAPRGSPVVVDGTVYVGSDDHKMYGLAPADGSVRWSWTAPAGVSGTVVGDVAYLGADDGLFRAIAVGDKSERWHLRVLSGLVSSPTIGDHTVFFAARQGGADPNSEMYAVDRATGKVRWTFRAPSGLQVNPSILQAGVVYTSSQQDGLFAFAEEDGRLIWHVDAPPSFIPAAMAGDVIYVTGSRGVTAFSAADGHKLWETDTSVQTSTSPVLSGGMLFVGDTAGSLRAFAEPGLLALLAAANGGPQAASSPGSSGAPSATIPDPFTLVATFDAKTSGLDQPSGMDMGRDGNLYVVDARSSRILVLTPSGKIVRSWGSKGSGPGQFDFVRDPSDESSDIGGVAVDTAGFVYVSDTANRRVEKFSGDGTFIRQWGRFGDADGQFLEPFDLDVARDGSVYVVDDTRDDIQKFDGDGGFIAQIGRHGTGAGELSYTSSVEVDQNGVVYNADWDNNRVQAWDPSGRFLWTLGVRGTHPGEFIEPSDVAIDGGRLFVADRTRVQVFDADRHLIGLWQSPDQGDQYQPGSIVVANGNAYVSQPFSGRILKLRLGAGN